MSRPIDPESAQDFVAMREEGDIVHRARPGPQVACNG